MTDLHKRAYVSGVRGVRTGLTRTGVMDRLDRWADESRTGLWVRSWFAVYDLDECEQGASHASYDIRSTGWRRSARKI